MSSRHAGRTRLLVWVLDAALLTGGVVGLSTVGPSSQEVRAADERARARSRMAVDPFADRSTGVEGVQSLPPGVVVGPESAPAPVLPGPGDGGGPVPGRVTPPPVAAVPGRGAPSPSEGAIAATLEGTYENRVTDEVSGFGGEPGDPEEEEPSTETEIVRVTTSKRDANEVRQLHRTSYESDDPDEADEPEEEEYRWTRDALYLQAPDDEDTCSAEELRWLKLPLAANSTWSDHLECSYPPEDGEEGGSASIDFTSKVLGSRRVQAVGRSLLVWDVVMEIKSKSTHGSDTNDSATTLQMTFSPELGYNIRLVEEYSVNGMGDESMTFRTTTELVKFTPAA